MANGIIAGCGVHHIALNVSNFEASVRFYTQGLGFQLFRKWGTPERTVALIDTGDQTYLELFSGAQKPADVTGKEAGSFVHLAFRVNNTKEAFARALQFGATPHTEPKTVDIASEPALPVAISFVNGPDGELLEFFEVRE